MQKQQNYTKGKTPLPEKMIGGAGLLLLIMVIGYLIDLALQPGGPPELRIRQLFTIVQDNAYLVEIEVYNAGRETAKDAIIEGQLLPSGVSTGTPVETSETTFDYVPPSSSRRGGLIFHHSPADYKLLLRAKSYIRL
ncbi:hypothetical protein [Nitrosococcus wardiae]|uniref:TIGR02588 family protein n=1 Tax=Nitrosococcus wardiae TaxID=1814290 RepID=A0A4P7BYF4_9GAMM|nr:hypothetical protein [Nitrosococcus wardiae]QBQ53446.1 hypothetical protein E3U44_02215 [Nitrosococcus wardiae]